MPRVSRLLPILFWVWRVLFGFLGGLIVNLAYDQFFGQAPIPTVRLRDFISTNVVVILWWLLILLVLTGLSIWDKRRRIDDRLLSAATVKAAKDLRPGIRRDNADVSIANYRSEVYLEREGDEAADTTLTAFGGVILIGRPRSGKSRTAFEMLRRCPQALVVIPRDLQPPTFSPDGLRGQDVILFIDDLHLRAPTLDVIGWQDRLRNARVRSLSVVCTSRDGMDWARVEEHQRLLVQQFGSECRVYTSRSGAGGTDITFESGRQLAEMLDLGLSEGDFERRFDGTPGSLTLDLAEMGARYGGLSRERLDGALGCRLLESVKLLHRGGQPGLREDHARAVAETIRGNLPLSNETWDALRRRTEEEGFGVFVGGEFRTYRPYLESEVCVSYEPSDEEIRALLPLLEVRQDFEGLFYLGAECQESNIDLAKRAYQSSADGGFGWAANNLGTILLGERDLNGAEVALNRAIELDADLAYGNLGKLLSDHTNRAQEAENAFREGAARGIANASFGLGHHLAKQPGREADAETAYREAIKRGDNRALLNLGNLLMNIPGRRGEVEQLFRDAIAAGVVEAYNSLGTFLLKEGNRADAEMAYRTGAENGFALCSYNLAEMLADDPKRWNDAEQSYRDAIAAGASGSQLRLGVRLSEQPGKELVAAAELEKAIDAGEIDADGFLRLGTVLMRIPGRGESAEAALRNAMNAGDREAINRLGILIANLPGREAQAEVILTTATVVAPQVAHRNLGVLLARQDGRERDAETAFRAAITAGDGRGYLDLGMLLLRSPRRSVEACTALQRAVTSGISEAGPLFREHCV